MSSATELPCENCPLFLDNSRLNYIKTISDSKLPVYLVQDTQTKKLQVIKLFPWDEEKNQPCVLFKRECRFAQISHPNIIQINGFKVEQETFSSEDVDRVSYTLMEYTKNGDLFDALVTNKIPFDETLIRTYFHQIIAGLEIIHANKAAHLDIKLENILLADDYTAKIADFDLSYMPEDKIVSSEGTVNFRAPEIIEGSCENPQAADIYALGVMLFLLKSGGKLPFKERSLYHGIDMKGLLETNTKEFWKKQCEFLCKEASFFSEDFKRLFIGMTQQFASNRLTIEQIKKSPWFNGKTYSKEKAFAIMNQKSWLN